MECEGLRSGLIYHWVENKRFEMSRWKSAVKKAESVEKRERKQFKRFEKNARILKRPSTSVSSGHVYPSAFPALLANIYRVRGCRRRACCAHVTERCRSVWNCVVLGWAGACTCEWLASAHVTVCVGRRERKSRSAPCRGCAHARCVHGSGRCVGLL